MQNLLIQDIASMLLTGGIFGWIFKKLFKFPLILGYIFAGILISLPIPYTPTVVKPHDAQSLAELGMLLLLFSMGLHFGIRKIKSLGFKSLFVGAAESLFMWFTAFLIAKMFFSGGENKASFLGAAFAASSTVVIVKTLEEFELKSARFAEKVTGVLLVEDSVAIFIIIWLSTASSLSTTAQEHAGSSLAHLIVFFLGSIFAWWVLGTILVPRIIRSAFLTGKEELLLILSLGFALGLAYLSASWEFSSALGAFIMGSILSECRELRKIENLIEPVKNLFSLIFFVSVGLLFSPSILISEWKFVLLFAFTTIAGKILYNLIFNLFVGQGLKDAIRMSGCMGQIGELSFVIAQIGKVTNTIDDKLFSAIIAVAIITMLSTPFIMKLFFSIAEKSDSIFPKRILEFIDAYSESLADISLSQSGQKISFVRKFRVLFSQTQEKIRKNYLRVTSKNVTSTLDRLAPWDEYLVPVRVESNTAISGKNLLELKLRENFNINVVAIERDMQTIVSPKPTDVVMDGDTLLVYGNEKSVAKLEHVCCEQIDSLDTTTIDDCSLTSITLSTPLHPFVGHSILELGIRESHNCIVLAVNRKNERIKNPVSSFKFFLGDEIFLFGTKKALSKLSENN